MPPTPSHFPQENDHAPDATQPTAPHPPLDGRADRQGDSWSEAPTVAPAVAPAVAPRRAARPTMPIRPPTLPGLEDEIRTANAEARAEVQSRALAPVATPGVPVPASAGQKSSALLIRGAARPRHPGDRVVPRRNGPRSFMAQFLAAMLIAVVLVSGLALTTPLGQTMAAATNGQFAASSGVFIPAPTATHTPKPTPSYTGPVKGVNPGQQVIINEINAVFGQYAAGALNIARCESGYDPNAVNSYPIGNSHASGVFQILYPSTWNTTSYRTYSPFDYDKNIHAAYEIFHRDGNSWREWACKP